MFFQQFYLQSLGVLAEPPALTVTEFAEQQDAGTLVLDTRTAAHPVDTTPQINVHDLKARLDHGEISLLDVRQPDEWHAGHVPGAELPDRLDEVPDTGPLAVTCGSGYRSSVSASLLTQHGHRDVVNVTGGMAAWNNAGYPVEK